VSEVILLNQKSQLEKLEHKIDASLINAAKYLGSIIVSLKEIQDSKLYIIRNWYPATIRVKNRRLNVLHNCNDCN